MSTCRFVGFLKLKRTPSPIWDFRCQGPACMGEYTCRFFHRFPTGTFCIPEPMPSPIHNSRKLLGCQISYQMNSICSLNCYFKPCFSGLIWSTSFVDSKILLLLPLLYPPQHQFLHLLLWCGMVGSYQFIYKFTYLWQSGRNINTPLNNLIHVT